MILSRRTIQEAVEREHFDGFRAQGKMKPIPRAMYRAAYAPGTPRQGAVLLLLYLKQQQVHLVLTRRRDDLNSHAGQISLPGGRREGAETLEEAAVREAQEEIGVQPEAVTILGSLTPLYIPPSDFEVHPFVGWYVQTPIFVRQVSEVAEIIEVPLEHLLAPETREEEEWDLRGSRVTVPFFRIDTHKVWGATAMILSEFVERLRK